MRLCDDYANFRAWVPRNILSVGTVNPRNFIYYDWGPRNAPIEPLICLHAVAGSAEVFFLQILGLAPRGYRVVSLEIPSYFSVEEFCQGFQSFLDTLGFRKIHIYGAGLGGFLGLCYASRNPEQVGSLILTHSFSDSSGIRATFPVSSSVIPWLPEFLLRKFLLERLPKGRMERRVAAATEFVISKIKLCDSEQLASRLSLTTLSEKLDTVSLQYFNERVTILSTLDWIAGSSLAKQLHKELCEQFSHARIALMKDGGDFPYLSRSDELNVHLLVHLRRYALPPGTPLPLPPPARKRDTQPVFRVSKGSPRLVTSKASSNSRFTGSDASKIAKLRELLPDYSEQFLEAALLVYHGSLEDTLQSILEGSLPEDFVKKSKEYIPPQSGDMNAVDDSVSRQRNTEEESTLEENLLLPPKQINRGVVERNPLEYEKSHSNVENSSDAIASMSSNRFDLKPGEIFSQSQTSMAQTQLLNGNSVQGEVSCFEGPPLKEPFISVESMEQNLPLRTQNDVYMSNFDTVTPSANANLLQSLDLLTSVTKDSEFPPFQRNDVSDVTAEQSKGNGHSSEVVDKRLLEWKMSAYTSPSFQKPQ
ncbi:Maspardin [Galdieria sulphuraria]|nr:Maspardin [Galdieria sulphuraria]